MEIYFLEAKHCACLEIICRFVYSPSDSYRAPSTNARSTNYGRLGPVEKETIGSEHGEEKAEGRATNDLWVSGGLLCDCI